MKRPTHNPNSIYHVYNRGTCKMKIFINHNNYKYYLSKMTKYKEKFKINILAFCLMPNHIHLLLRNISINNKSETNFSKFIQSLHTSYAMYFNKMNKHQGHVFESTYKKKEIDTDEYLETIINYIHENPVRKKLCNKKQDWPYSSAKTRTDLKGAEGVFNGTKPNTRFWYK